MKTEKNILIAFILNLAFSLFELIGGTMTGSIAIISDSVHDIGDAMSIGISFFLERKSKNHPDDKYTYGYTRYSVLGGLITTTILLIGSIFVIVGAIKRMIHPIEIHYDGMIIFAIVGVIINYLAAHLTKEGDSINQKSVNLHMLEDVLGWLVVLVGAILMKFTDIVMIDSLMSIGVATFILISAFKNLMDIADLFLEKVPNKISVEEIKSHLMKLEGVCDVHHVHIWSIDGITSYATMHVVLKEFDARIKTKIREELSEHGITHVTIELETEVEHCDEPECHVDTNLKPHTHHHH